MTKARKILVLCSAAKEVPLREGGAHPTGNFLGELTEPMEALIEAGSFSFVFATPQGKPISIDANSYKTMYWGYSRANLDRGRKVFEAVQRLGLEKPAALETLVRDEKNLDEFDCLFVPGGHGPMVDLLHEDFNRSDAPNAHTSKLLEHFHRKAKITALICHAPAILACAPKVGGEWIYKGYGMTCVSQFSEWMTEDFFLTRVVHGHLKEYPTHLLKALGGKLRQVPVPMVPVVVRDRELLTGQDPYSGKKLGQELLSALR